MSWTRADSLSLMAAVPEAVADPGDHEYYRGDEPLTYPALGDARMWIEDHALEFSGMARLQRMSRQDTPMAVRASVLCRVTGASCSGGHGASNGAAGRML